MLEDQFCAEKRTLETFVQLKVADGQRSVLLKKPIFGRRRLQGGHYSIPSDNFRAAATNCCPKCSGNQHRLSYI